MTESEFQRQVQAQIGAYVGEGARHDALLRLELAKSLLLNDALIIARFGYVTENILGSLREHYEEYCVALSETKQ